MVSQYAKKSFRRIQSNAAKISERLCEVFREFNELGLLYNSKLCHALKDLQEFLLFQDSQDPAIQAIQNKLEMLLHI